MAIAHVQTKTSTTPTTSVAVTFDGAPTQGNLLVAGVMWNSSPASQSIQSGWTAAIAETAVGGGPVRVFWKIAGAGESTTQTAITHASTAHSCTISEWSPDTGFIWDTNSLEFAIVNADADATKTTTGSADPADGVTRLLVGYGFSDGNRTFSAQKFNGSTTDVAERGDIGQGTANGGETCCVFDKVEASTASGNYTAEAVASASDDGGVALLIFKQTASGPPPQDTPELRGRPFGLFGAQQMRQLIVQ